MSTKLSTIQSLRALAILVVLIFHVNPKWMPRGFLGVDMFFVISGYLMAKVFYDKGGSLAKTIEFYQRRFKRIMPCYSLTILAVVWIGRFVLVKVDRENLFADALYSLGLISNLQPLFTKFDYWQMISEFKFLAHTWSLACEMQFYLLTPLIFFVLQRANGRGKIIISTFLCSISMIVLLILPPSQSFGLVFCRLWQFLAGIGVYLLWPSIENNSRRKPQIFDNEKPEVEKSLLGQEFGKAKDGGTVETLQSSLHSRCIVGLFILNLALTFFSFLPIFISRPLVVLTTTAIIRSSQIKEHPYLTWQPISYLGDISYVMYLIHWPLITFLRIFNPNVLESELFGAFIMLGLSVVLSVLAHHTIEKHFLDQQGNLWFSFTGLCYLLALLGIFLPIQSKEHISFGMFNTTKDCEGLSTMPKTASFDYYSKKERFGRHYGELTGDGDFDVLVIGNSYLKNYENWPDKVFRKRFRKYYLHDISTCFPFLDYRGFHQAAKVCEGFSQTIIKEIEEKAPKITLFILGWALANDLLVENFENMSKTAIERVRRLSALTDYLLITSPVYYLDDKMAHQNARIIETGQDLSPRNETQFLYQQYLHKMGPSLRLLYESTRNCSNCVLIDTQPTFCVDGVHCDVFDYDCRQNLYDWGGRHHSTFARNRIQPVYQMAMDQIYLRIEQEKNDTE